MKILNVDTFSPWAHVNGWFTQKNADLVNSDGQIRGLNCGLRTEAPSREVESNRQQLFAALRLNPDQVVTAGQVHGDRVQVVDRGGYHPGTDALVTAVPGLVLTIQVADCAALLLADPERSVVAAVHAGWRGAVAGIVPKTVQVMTEQAGAKAEEIRAYISPCISLAHFEVGREVATLFPERFLDADSFEKPHVDLKGYLLRQLEESGVSPERVSVDSGCTWRNGSAYYSWRRERKAAGRMLALIQLERAENQTGS